MNRKIEFRVFDKKLGICQARSILQWIISFAEYEWKAQSDQTERFTDLIWLQSSEMNDINENRIYEGDILSPININGVITEAVVEFNNGCFMVKQSDAEGLSDFLYLHNETTKIIGNIYEQQTNKI